MPTTDLLTLAEARKALRKAPTDTVDDADITATYIPAVTTVVEDVCGPVVARTGLTWAVDGGHVSYTLPVAPTAVTAVTESAVTLVPNVDYTVNLRSGIVTRGSMQQPYIFLPGQSNIVVTYNAGTVADTASVPANIKLAARIILRQLWIADQQGGRPAFGQPDQDTVTTPSGFALPRRAFELLQPVATIPGFA